MIKPGTYKGRVAEAAMCRANSGTDYVGAVFVVFEDGAEVGRAPWSGWLTEKTEARTAASLKALGWDGTVGASGEITSLTRVVDVGIIEEEYQGRFTTKVDWVGEPPFAASIRSQDRLTLSQAKAQVSRLQRLAGAGGDDAQALGPKF